jgi:hypothetical protein
LNHSKKGIEIIKIKYSKMLFPLIVTLVLVTPVAGFIAGYQCLYSHMPFEGINRVGVEQDTIGIDENAIGVEIDENTSVSEENDIRAQEGTIGDDKTLMGFKEDYIEPEQDNIIMFFNNNVRLDEQDSNIGVE